MSAHKVKGGYKFGKSGKTYRGKGAKKKAQKQARRYMQADIRMIRNNVGKRKTKHKWKLQS